MSRAAIMTATAGSIFVCTASTARAQEFFRLHGIVADTTYDPVGGVTVRVLGTYWQTITTADSGRFSLALPAGEWDLELRRVGFQTDTFAVELGGERSRMLTLVLRPTPVDLPAIAVSARKETGFGRVVTREAIRAQPSLAEPDVFRPLVLLPAVTQPNDFGGRIHLAGGASDETGVRLDGHPLQIPFHLFGLLGSFNVAALDRAELAMHHLSSDRGGYLSGIIDLHTRSPVDEPTYSATASLLSASFTSTQPDLPFGLDLLASGRITYVDRLGPLIYEDFPRIGYQDALARVSKDLQDWHVEGLFYLSHNFFRDAEADEEPRQPLRWGEFVGGVRAERTSGRWTFRVRAAVDRAYASWDERPEGTRVFDVRRHWLSGAAELLYRGKRWKLLLGASGDIRDNDQSWRGIRESDDLILASDVPEAFSGRNDQATGALFGEVTFRAGPAEVQPGLRLVAGPTTLSPAPRLRVAVDATDEVILTASADRRLQFSTFVNEPIEGSILPPVFLLAQPEVVDLLALGGDWWPGGSPNGRDTHLELTTFVKKYHDRAVLRSGRDGPFPSFQRVPGSAFGASIGFDTPLGEDGIVQGSYTFERARHEIDGRSMNTDWDTPHNLSLFASLPLSDSWTASAAFQLHSGRPVTPLRGVVLSPRLEPFSVSSRRLPGRRNSGRVSTALRLDLGARHEWPWLGADWALFIQVLNATNHRNLLSPDFNQALDNQREDDPRRGLPITPSFGVEVRW